MAETGEQHVSFFARVTAELKKLFTHAPGWEASAAATMTYVAPMVEAVVALTDPAAAPVVTALLAKIQSATAAAAVLIKDAGPAPTLITYLEAIKRNLVLIEASAGVKDGAALAKLNTLVTSITGEVDAVLAELQSVRAAI